MDFQKSCAGWLSKVTVLKDSTPSARHVLCRGHNSAVPVLYMAHTQPLAPIEHVSPSLAPVNEVMIPAPSQNPELSISGSAASLICEGPEHKELNHTRPQFPHLFTKGHDPNETAGT